jgi:hypothetical protein
MTAMRARVRSLLDRTREASPVDLATDLGHALWPQFHQLVRDAAPQVAVEVGSRARSGNIYRDWLPDTCRYVGFDVHAGPNVDVVGDAHQLSSHLERDSVDVAWSISTFEHLAMPWVAAVELGHVMKLGGLVYVQSHQTWPVHDAPWDFWRFSKFGWDTLFHKYSGFEVIAAEMGEPASVRAHVQHPPTIGLEDQPAFLFSAVIARKIGESDLRWEVPLDEVLRGSRYPSGEITT